MPTKYYYDNPKSGMCFKFYYNGTLDKWVFIKKVIPSGCWLSPHVIYNVVYYINGKVIPIDEDRCQVWSSLRGGCQIELLTDEKEIETLTKLLLTYDV